MALYQISRGQTHDWGRAFFSFDLRHPKLSATEIILLSFVAAISFCHSVSALLRFVCTSQGLWLHLVAKITAFYIPVFGKSDTAAGLQSN